ncbi:MAG TPA: flagellar hook-length control protein FliK [Methyloversatilis sp.]
MNELLPGLAQRLAALTRDSVQVAGAISPIGEQLPDFRAGDRYSALILQNLQDGRARAQVAGQTVTLQLPQAAIEGSTVTLTHVGRSAQTLIATLAPQTTAPEAPDAVQISQSARTISALLDSPAPPPAKLAAGQPLIDTALLRASANVTDSSTTSLIAGRLSQAIGQSGLFYEAHQAQWVNGERTIESTAAEPQRAFDPLPKKALLPGHADSAAAEAPETRPAPPSNETPAKQTVEAGRQDAGPPGELRPLVQNQLLGLSQHTLAWEGLAWPGQTMKLEIDDAQQQSSGERDGNEPAAEVPWTSRLRLVLPGLGEIETSLTLWKDHGVALNVSAGADARARMGAALIELQQRMTDAGLRLGTVSFAAPSIAGDGTLPASQVSANDAGSTG